MEKDVIEEIKQYTLSNKEKFQAELKLGVPSLEEQKESADNRNRENIEKRQKSNKVNNIENSLPDDVLK